MAKTKWFTSLIHSLYSLSLHNFTELYYEVPLLLLPETAVNLRLYRGIAYCCAIAEKWCWCLLISVYSHSLLNARKWCKKIFVQIITLLTTNSSDLFHAT